MLVAAALLGTLWPGQGARAAGSLPPIHHVWVVMLENESSSTTFSSPLDPYLRSLPASGALIPNYYGIGHASLDNYIALIGGQSPAADTQADCQAYQGLVPGTPPPSNPDGQVVGQGCVYPSSRLTVADQLDKAGLTWKGYMEDLGQDRARDDPVTCQPPGAVPVRDQTQTAEAQDQYAARHDPFMYYASVVGNSQECSANVVRLQDDRTGLVHDLQSTATTPNYSFITPNLCNDGHDTGCRGPDVAGSSAGGLASVDHWLQAYVPRIVNSPAFQQDGMLVITFDEGDSKDTASCCNEVSGPNTAAAGGQNGGTGGGQVGAIVLSPFVRPGSTTSTAYNHYSLLRTVEDIFGLGGGDDGNGHLGYAGTYSDYPGPGSFGSDVFATSPVPITVALPPIPPESLGYWLVGADGGIFPFGSAGGYGSTGGIHLNSPIVGIAPGADSAGYWLVASDGGVFPFGAAPGYGSTGGIRLNRPIVGMAATPDGRGYWLVASDGGIFPFGDAPGYGSTGNIRLNKPIVGMATTRDGNGYWLDASDGGIFPFGDAPGYGSLGKVHLNTPIVGMAGS